MFGDNLRVLLLNSTIPLASGIASVALDRVFFILSGVVVMAVGLIAVLLIWPLAYALALYTGVIVLILLRCHSCSGANGATAVACGFCSHGILGSHSTFAWVDRTTTLFNRLG